MKLTEALQTLNQAESLQGMPFMVLLACGFTPLHLETFLAAHLQKSLPRRRIRITSGLYGDLAGTLERQPAEGTHAAVVVIEWSDLEPRLGYRSLGGWGPAEEAEVAEQARIALARLCNGIEKLSLVMPVAVSLPTLPLAPAFHTSGWQAGKAELELWSELVSCAASLVDRQGVSIVSVQYLADQSPFANRFDLKSDIVTGHPYTLAHADAVASTLAQLVQPAVPKKGLITDLDDTLWRGIVGEVGADSICWDVSNHAQVHGFYQQTLAALAAQGVLLAVASKNNPDAAERALARRDILLKKEKIFPMEVHWGPKSESVGRILTTWNIGPDSIVFVDDSPMELAEVKAVWPDVHCVLFPKDDPSRVLALLRELRDIFGKGRLSAEDGLRLASIRAASAFRFPDSPGEQQEVFLSQAKAVLTAHFNPPATDSRIIELVNKTNQFNMNGIRYSEAEWQSTFVSKDSFVLAVSYDDRYGQLGKIAILAGRMEDRAFRIHTWVMSCRAFSRRIEHRCIELLLSQLGADELIIDYAATPKNRPFRECFVPFLGITPEGPFVLTRAQFLNHCPKLYGRVEVIK